MKNISFYRVLTDTDNNFYDDKNYLTVNCTGHTSYTEEISAGSVRHDYYLFYLHSGITNVISPKLPRQMAPGDLVIFSPEKEFHYIKPSGIEMEYYWVHFSGAAAHSFLKECGLELDVIHTVGVSEIICEKFRKLFDAFLHKDKLFYLKSANYMAALLLELASGSSPSEQKSAGTAGAIGSALSYIHSRQSEEVSVERLAQIVHMSPGYFRSVFKSATGVSPKDYITLTKLKTAGELLRQTGMSIKEISFAAGYSDLQYFSRIFKKHYGIPPGAYRQKIQFETVDYHF